MYVVSLVQQTMSKNCAILGKTAAITSTGGKTKERETSDDGFSQKIVATLGWWLVAEKADSHSAGRRKINCFDFWPFQFFISLLWAFYSFTYFFFIQKDRFAF